MAVANTLAYYVMATITAVKSFIVQAPAHFAFAVSYVSKMFMELTPRQ